MKEVLTAQECVAILLARVDNYRARGADDGSAIRLTAHDFQIDADRVEVLWLDAQIAANRALRAHG